MLDTKINIPKISFLEIQLIINNQLFEDGVISEVQYDEVCKIIYDKINLLRSKS